MFDLKQQSFQDGKIYPISFGYIDVSDSNDGDNGVGDIEVSNKLSSQLFSYQSLSQSPKNVIKVKIMSPTCL